MNIKLAVAFYRSLMITSRELADHFIDDPSGQKALTEILHSNKNSKVPNGYYTKARRPKRNPDHPKKSNYLHVSYSTHNYRWIAQLHRTNNWVYKSFISELEAAEYISKILNIPLSELIK